MPFTPFHFGPGALLHSAAPRYVSFLAFCGANVLVDVEPLYFMLTGQHPIHRFFHTYVGATVAAAIVIAAFAIIRRTVPGCSLRSACRISAHALWRSARLRARTRTLCSTA